MRLGCYNELCSTGYKKKDPSATLTELRLAVSEVTGITVGSEIPTEKKLQRKKRK